MNNVLSPALITEKINILGDFFLTDYKKDAGQQNISLLCGLGGSVLLQSLLYDHTGEDKYAGEMQKNVEVILQKLKFVDYDNKLMSTFCIGVSGVCWLFLYLKERELLDFDTTEFFTDIDPILKREMNNFIAESDYDILHGAMGIALYFAKKGDFQPAELIIAALQKEAIYCRGTISWKRYDKYHAHTYIHDLGLAHGQSAILYFLGKCYKYGINSAVCRELLLGGLELYAQMKKDPDEVGSYYQLSLLTEDFLSNVERYKPSRSRLAWCYGDLGILHTLLLIAGWLDDKTLFREYENMLVRTTLRVELEDAMVRDAQFCHGATGISVMYKSAYNRTGNPALKSASEYWLSQALSMGNSDSWTCGYLFQSDKKIPQPAIDILGGLGGVALNLLLFNNDEFPEQATECLFLC